jgi:hypothetical protein
MQTLLDYDLMSSGEVVQAGGHGAVEPFHGLSPLAIGFRLFHTVRIVDHQDIGTLAGSCAADRSRDAIARAVILETVLLILICAQMINVTPTLLVPLGFNQPAAPHTVAHAEGGGIAGQQPARLGSVDPDPGRPKHARQQGLGVTGGHVNDQIADPAFADRLQMLADGLHVHAVDEGRGWLQYRPTLHDKLIQAAARSLRPQCQQFGFGRAQAGFPSVGFRRR